MQAAAARQLNGLHHPIVVMVKAYLRYDFTGAFGVITSSANPEFDATGKQLVTGALENALVWNIKQGTQVDLILAC